MPEIKIQELTKDFLNDTIEMSIRAFNNESVRENAEIDFPISLENNKRPHICLIGLIDDQVVGAVQCMHGNLSVDIYNILWVCVDPEHQNKGYGRQLVDQASQYIEENFLKGKQGTIVLVSDINPTYYQQSGFFSETNTHSGGTIMRKIVGA